MKYLTNPSFMVLSSLVRRHERSLEDRPDDADQKVNIILYHAKKLSLIVGIIFLAVVIHREYIELN